MHSGLGCFSFIVMYGYADNWEGYVMISSEEIKRRGDKAGMRMSPERIECALKVEKIVEERFKSFVVKRAQITSGGNPLHFIHLTAFGITILSELLLTEKIILKEKDEVSKA